METIFIILILAAFIAGFALLKRKSHPKSGTGGGGTVDVPKDKDEQQTT